MDCAMSAGAFLAGLRPDAFFLGTISLGRAPIVSFRGITLLEPTLWRVFCSVSTDIFPYP
jgi:hypothetical protein